MWRYSQRDSENVETEIDTVNIVIGYGWPTGLRFPSGKGVCLFVESGSGAKPAPYIWTGVSFTEGKSTRAWSWPLTHSDIRILLFRMSCSAGEIWTVYLQNANERNESLDVRDNGWFILCWALSSVWRVSDISRVGSVPIVGGLAVILLTDFVSF
jgi:hypothetical protein